ncbi:DUF4129 domain-containing protein [Saccharomonospora sp. NPDC046836]|uniref:DUF4129 domain-containing protein n=1 Tax=Saccharomonospora sp. NPDC046836 TaxID=3156921 RepID=UPI0033C75C10
MIRVADVPVDIGRDAAQEAARAELTDPAYQQAEPGLVLRVLRWVGDRLADLFGGLGGLAPGGFGGLLVFAVLLVVLVVVVRLRAGKVVGRGSVTRREVFSGAPRTAADHRQSAELAHARGDLTEAVRERFRAIVRSLEERGVLDERSGRTADETAVEAGLLLPGSAAELRAAAVLFDEVHYGGQHASSDGWARLTALDADLVAGRLVAR